MKRFLKISIYTILVILLLLGALVGICIALSEIKEPEIELPSIKDEKVVEASGYQSVGKNWIRQSESGLWEVYVEGSDIERGLALGKLEKDLMVFQEKVFVDQINELVPSRSYVNFLKHLTAFYNRNLTDYIPLEYQYEIYGTTVEGTHEFDYIGTPYERQLNYHAAHDLGHAMQDYMLVGCTSFATWGDSSVDSLLTVGRNFDFYMGDAFAKNKVISFYNPQYGYKFAMVGWAGMTGVLSGMNTEGLTVTINAAKSDMPTSSAMPISLLARKILQYASTIQEAFAIADSAQTFVSESILIGSAKDKHAAIIEKSTEKTALYESNSTTIVCANHYQSSTFANDERNIENIRTSDSPYRQKRAEQLLSEKKPIDPQKAAEILRDTKGIDGQNIGLGNEKALNQLIGHHSVIFQPEKALMWVSTSHWQLGRFVAYDLNKIFNETHPDQEVYEKELEIKEDSLIYTPEFKNYLGYRHTKKAIKKSMSSKQQPTSKEIRNLTLLNPNLFEAYDIAGDAFWAREKKDSAVCYWRKALTLEIPKLGEREKIEEKIKEAED
ncbi:MAG: choloylglycine hydrolase [Paludibacteraceae bacterium]|nr:choloylglycine hydrolase [Paludibacteraceae bacterium]